MKRTTKKTNNPKKLKVNNCKVNNCKINNSKVNKVGHEEEVKPQQKIIFFDITPRTISTLPIIINQCLSSQTLLKIFSSEGDDTDFELAEIPHVKQLYVNACTQYGLLGFLIENQSLYLDHGIKDDIIDIRSITSGSVTDINSSGVHYQIDLIEFERITHVSIERYHALYY